MRIGPGRELPPEAVNLLTGLGTGAGLFVTDKSYDSGVWWATAAGVTLVIGSFVFGFIAARRNRIGQSAAAVRRTIRSILVRAATAFGSPGEHARACVMQLSPDGTRRIVDSLTAVNMESDPDVDWNIAAAAGLSGKAFAERRPAFGDPQAMLDKTGPTWGLTPAEKAKMRGTLRGILVAPVFDPDDPDSALLATIQIDTDRHYSEAGFDKPSSLSLIEAFADSVAVIMRAGR
jgi:hypothetical protein